MSPLRRPGSPQGLSGVHSLCNTAQSDEIGQWTPDLRCAPFRGDDGGGGDVSFTLLTNPPPKLIPATLITADRSPDVEQEARGNSLQLLRKPIKPAALRALITRLYQQRQAAE